MKYSIKSRFSVAFLLVIFFNAFVDLGHKVLLQDTLQHTLLHNGALGEHSYIVFTSILNAFILLPFILLFTPSGFISDKFSKTKVMFWSSLAAVPIMILITWAYYTGQFWLAYFMTLLLGVQSAINTPAKYGHIKELYSKTNLAKANAYTQAIGIIAILTSTCVFTVLFSHYMQIGPGSGHLSQSQILQRFAPLGFILIILSCLETIMTLFLIKRHAAHPEATYEVKDYFKLNHLKRYWRLISGNKVILICTLALTVYWSVSQLIIVSYGAFLTQHVAGMSTLFVQGSIAVAGVGVLFGALYAGKVSRGYIETGIIPVAAVALTVCLYLMTHTFNRAGVIIIELCYGFFGGLFIVPLNALIQCEADEKNLGKVMAGNSFCQNIGMFTFLVGNTVSALLNVSSGQMLNLAFLLFLALTVIAVYLLPQYLLRFIVSLVMRRFNDLNVIGLDNIPEKGGVLLIGNHTSYLDWAVIQMACSRKIRFVMERAIVEKWYFRWLKSKLNMIPISRGRSKESLQDIHNALNNGDVVCIFPEGRLCLNGQMGKFQAGFSRAAKGTSAVVVPFYIRGLWGTKLSYATPLYKKISRSGKRDLTLAIGSPIPAEVSISEAQQVVTQLSSVAWKDYALRHNNIAVEFYQRAKRGMMNTAVIDSVSPRITYSTLLATTYYLKRQWKDKLRDQNQVACLLPSSAAGMIANLSVLASAKTVVNINFTTSIDNIRYAFQTASIKTVITSRRFLQKLSKQFSELDELLQSYTIIYMEDCIDQSSKITIARYRILFRLLPKCVGRYLFADAVLPEHTAAIVFSSGSEGRPKGVELSHSNIIANIKQTATVCKIERSDVALATLPLFHAFGFTTSMLMPLLLGCPIICHPDPTDAKAIGKLVCKYGVTMMYGTSTFFNLYVRNKRCLPEMFTSLRVLIAGAEKLSKRVKNEFLQKFNKVIYEGYGTTELAPVAGCNLPNEIHDTDFYVDEFNREGTVGLPLPGSAYRIVDPNTMEDLEVNQHGLILVSGPQLMKGYFNDPDKTQEVIYCNNGVRWYRTGDKGFLDELGFLTIVDRYSRFAKIGGEMVSLGAVEQKVEAILAHEDIDVMAVATADERKGECIVLLYNSSQDSTKIREQLLAGNMDNLMLPSTYLSVDDLPRLASGKKDYITAKRIALSGTSELT